MKRPALTLTILASLAACAKAPEDIQAVPTEGRFDCAVETAALEGLEARQRQARHDDTIGVLLIGVPLASLNGEDLETQIAVAKGRVAACG